MSDTDRGQRATQLIRLGTEYGNLTDRKLQQWLDMTDHATPAHLEKAVDKILRDPEREHLPRIGAILANLPPRPGKERKFALWCWMSLTITGNIDEVPFAAREREAAFALRMFHPSLRGSMWFHDRARPMILAFDPLAFEKESERKSAAKLVFDPLAG